MSVRENNDKAQKKLILVVDDFMLNRLAILLTLTEELQVPEKQIIFATNGRKAVNLVRSLVAANPSVPNVFSLIITDFNMPEFNGLWTVEEINKIYQDQGCTAQKPEIVMVSGFMKMKEKRMAQKLGVLHVIEKPVKKEVLGGILLSLNY